MEYRSLLLLLMLLTLASVPTYSQEEKTKTDSLIALDEQHTEQEVLPGFYFGWSYIKPFGQYRKSQMVDFTDGTSEKYKGKSLGLGFELGYFYWLDGINFPTEKLRLGVKTVYFSPHFIFQNSYELNIADINNSFKVGPSLAYNSSGNFVLEANITLGPTISYNTYWENLNLLFNYGAELSIRYKPIYVGIGFTFGQYNLEREELKDRFTTSTSRMNVTFGFNF